MRTGYYANRSIIACQPATPPPPMVQYSKVQVATHSATPMEYFWISTCSTCYWACIPNFRYLTMKWQWMHQFCSSLTSNVSSDDCLKIDGTDLADHPLHSALHQPAHRISLIARNILVVWRAIFTVRHSKKWVAQTGYILQVKDEDIVWNVGSLQVSRKDRHTSGSCNWIRWASAREGSYNYTGTVCM